jgi:hypothetical protein
MGVRRDRIGTAVLAAIIIFLGGCGEKYSPPSGFENEVGGGSGSGGGGGDPVVPGSGGRKVSEIAAENADFAAYNGRPGKNGMRLAALTQLESAGEDVTTQSTLGLWGDNKFHIEGAGALFNGTFANAGFTDALILYYDKPMPGEFKISARIRIKRTGGVSTGKGINVGAYSNADAGLDDNGVPVWKAGQGSKGIGLFFRAESMPQFRLYYSDQFASTTAGTSAVLTPELNDLKIGKEYIYEVARVKIDPDKPESAEIEYQDGGSASAPVMKKSRNLMYTFKLLDSKTYEPVVYRGTAPNRFPVQLPAGAANYFPYTSSNTSAEITANLKQTGIPVDSNRHPVGNTTIEMAQALRGAVYPGISITGCVAEISQIKIWTSPDHGGEGLEWDYTADNDEGGKGVGDKPVFATKDTIPAYVPANSFALNVSPSKSINDETPVRNGVIVLRWSDIDSPAQWPALQASGYKIDITTIVSPYYADDKIHYQLFTIGETQPHRAFLDGGGNVAISGDTAGMQEGLNGEKAYKKWTISFDKTKITKGETASARFVLVARNLELDADKSAPDYSLLQTLPEYHFWIDVIRPDWD